MNICTPERFETVILNTAWRVSTPTHCYIDIQWIFWVTTPISMSTVASRIIAEYVTSQISPRIIQSPAVVYCNPSFTNIPILLVLRPRLYPVRHPTNRVKSIPPRLMHSTGNYVHRGSAVPVKTVRLNHQLGQDQDCGTNLCKATDGLQRYKPCSLCLDTTHWLACQKSIKGCRFYDTHLLPLIS